MDRNFSSHNLLDGENAIRQIFPDVFLIELEQ